MQVLIIGASGYVGSHIFEETKRLGIPSTGTSCTSKSQEYVHFDLCRDDILTVTTDMRDEKKVAVICSAVSNIDLCKRNHKIAYDINVTATKRVMEALDRQNFHIIFFSTDQVFDGITGGYQEDSPVNPTNEYGKMKVEIEFFLTTHIPNACIFRISKVVGDDRSPKNLFWEWEQKQKNGRTVCCIRDNPTTFVDVKDVVNASLLAAERSLGGIYHLCSDEVILRTDLAHTFCRLLGSHSMEILEQSVEEFQFLENRPTNLCMKNEKFKREQDYVFSSMEEVMKRYLEKGGSGNKYE